MNPVKVNTFCEPPDADPQAGVVWGELEKDQLLPDLCCVYQLAYSTNSATVKAMANITEILSQMRKNPKGIKFNDLCKVCDSYFGKPRQSGSSHRVYKTPWVGDPRVNIQNNKGKAKPYQVRQVLQAVERMEVDKND